MYFILAVILTVNLFILNRRISQLAAHKRMLSLKLVSRFLNRSFTANIQSKNLEVDSLATEGSLSKSKCNIENFLDVLKVDGDCIAIDSGVPSNHLFLLKTDS